MKAAEVRAIMARVLATQTHSLARYLQYAAPWSHEGEERASAVLQLVASDQQKLSERLGDYMLTAFGCVDSGQFPMEFTAVHDLSLDYLLRYLATYQRKEIKVLKQCVAQLATEPEAQQLAQEALGAAQGHLESIEEVAGQLSK